VRCEYRGDDSKRCPISREYVDALETRIAKLESFLAELKTASGDERNRMVDEIAFIDHLPSVAAPEITTHASDNSDLRGLDTKETWMDGGESTRAICL